MKINEILTENAGKLKTINAHTIVIDGRDMSESAIRKMAEKHFKLDTERLPGREGGVFLGKNLIKYYNVKSVMDGIIVASTKKLEPSDTKPIATEFAKTL